MATGSQLTKNFVRTLAVVKQMTLVVVSDDDDLLTIGSGERPGHVHLGIEGGRRGKGYGYIVR